MGNNNHKGKDCHRKGNDDRDREKNPEEKRDKEKHKDERIENVGQVTLDENKDHHKIHLRDTIIWEAPLRPPNMSIFCRSLQRLRTAKRLTVF